MRRAILIMLVAALVVMPALAIPGGMPAAHGADGRTFGCLVSTLAQGEPGAVAEHVAGCTPKTGSMAGGMPALHGLSGADFGQAVKALATSAPGAVADHVSGCP